MWVSLGLGPLALLIPFVCFYLGFLAVRNRSFRAATALLCSPLFILFILGGYTWFSKKPAYRFAGLPKPEAFNLKAESRCYALSSGCILDGSEIIVHSSYNAGLSSMCTLFGWPPQTYHGRFPSQNEAAQLTENGQRIQLEDFEKGKIGMRERTLLLQPEVAERMLFGAEVWQGLDQPGESVLIRAALDGDGCLIVRVSNRRRQQPLDHIYLFDSKRMKAFARYQIGHRTSTPPFFAALGNE